MSYLSDPDRLERLATYALDFPPNATPEELSEALTDAAERIRSSQAKVRASRKLLDDILALHAPGEPHGTPIGNVRWCSACGITTPCPTVRLIENHRNPPKVSNG